MCRRSELNTLCKLLWKESSFFFPASRDEPDYFTENRGENGN